MIELPDARYIVGGAAIALLLAAASPESLRRCSKSDYPSEKPEFFFVGVATARLTPAGWAGAKGLRRADPDTTDVGLHGQIFEIARSGGASPDAQQAFRHAVVVPWGYSADCTPLPWSGTWVSAGTRGLVWGLLRDRAHWVDDQPTIDMHLPYTTPYPHPRTRDPHLSADELFDLVNVLSTSTSDSASLPALMKWAEANPSLVERQPASLVIHGHLWSISYQRMRAIEPAFAGTWRFTLDIGDAAPRIFFARTAAHPTSPHGQEEGNAWRRELRAPRFDSYALIANVAASEDELETETYGEHAYLYAMIRPDTLADDALVWRAGAELNLAARALPHDTSLQRIARVSRTSLTHYVRTNLPPAAMAAFRTFADGRAIFQQEIVLSDGVTVTLRGQRISPVTLSSPR